MASTRTVVWTALACNAAIAASKFVAYAFVGSPSLLAEGYHSIADTVNQVFLLVSLALQQRPSTARHPFGHGKERFFWAFLAALFIFTGGAWAAVSHGVASWRDPEREVLRPAVAFAVLGVAAVFEGVSCILGLKGLASEAKRLGTGLLDALRRSRDSTLKTALGEDLAALAGLLIAATGIALHVITGDHRYDAAASIAIGLLLAAVAAGLALESRRLLIGESASVQDRERISAILTSDPAIEEVAELLTMHLAPDNILVNAHVGIAPDVSAQELARRIDVLEDRIREAIPAVRRVFIEAQPAGHHSLRRQPARPADNPPARSPNP